MTFQKSPLRLTPQRKRRPSLPGDNLMTKQFQLDFLGLLFLVVVALLRLFGTI